MIAKWFSFDLESPCRCNCGQNIIDELLVAMADNLRDELGVMHVTSWNRCEKHNANVGGVENSFHVQGKAMDFVPRMNIFEAQKICKKLWMEKNILIGGLGLYNGPKGCFIHIDSGNYRIWTG